MSSATNIPVSLFAGGGVGLLFGVIMGSSVTPTVAIMLGALTTLLGGILGLNDSLFNNAKALRIGAFGIACVVGAWTGIYVRSHNLLAPTPEQIKQKYMAAGFSESQALEFVAMKEFGVSLSAGASNATSVTSSPSVLSSGNMKNKATSPTNSEPQQSVAKKTTSDSIAATVFKQHNSLLFSAKVDVTGCDELMFTDHSLPLDEILNNFELTGGMWEDLAARVQDSVPNMQQKEMLLASKDTVCGYKEQTINNCDETGALLKQGDWRGISSVNAQWAGRSDELSSYGLPDALSLAIMQQVHRLLCQGETDES